MNFFFPTDVAARRPPEDNTRKKKFGRNLTVAKCEWTELVTAKCYQKKQRQRDGLGDCARQKAKMFVQMGRYLQKHVLEGANVAPANKATLTEFANPPSAHCPRARGGVTYLGQVPLRPIFFST